MKYAMPLLYLLTALNWSYAQEPIKQDGRTWVWCEPLKMYRPDGAGWQYDSDRETWWRFEEPAKEGKQPKAIYRPRIQYGGHWWNWDDSLGVYRPEGQGWSWDGHCWSREGPSPSPQAFGGFPPGGFGSPFLGAACRGGS